MTREDDKRPITRESITWEVLEEAAVTVEDLKQRLGIDGYAEYRDGFQTYLTDYFKSCTLCDREQGSSISPMGKNAAGGKILKVRWLLPGYGKSGGLRVVVVAFCDERRVKLAGAWARKDAPLDVQAAADKATRDPQ